MTNPTTILRRLTLWTIVCAVSAAPSFIWASKEFDRRAMVVGVALFILAYTVLTSTAAFDRFHARPFVRRTLYIGYVTRLSVSGFIPLGMAFDLLPGMLSIRLVNSIAGDAHGFAGTLATTVVQGALLNVVLTLFMSVVYSVQRIFLDPPPPQGSAGFEVVMPVPPFEP